MIQPEQVSMAAALLAGIISFLSPCVLPMIPAYVGYLTGSSLNDLEGISKANYKTLAISRSLGFILGFTLVFVLLGASASFVGKLLGSYRFLLRQIGGVLILIFGLHMTGLLPIRFLYYEKRMTFNSGSKSVLSAMVMGMAFAAGWTPCVGPILAAILLYAGASGTVGEGMLLLGIYSLGLGVPFIATALLIDRFIRVFQRYARYLPYVSVVGGALMLVMGILIITNKMQLLNQYFTLLGNLEKLLIK